MGAKPNIQPQSSIPSLPPVLYDPVYTVTFENKSNFENTGKFPSNSSPPKPVIKYTQISPKSSCEQLFVKRKYPFGTYKGEVRLIREMEQPVLIHNKHVKGNILKTDL